MFLARQAQNDACPTFTIHDNDCN